MSKLWQSLTVLALCMGVALVAPRITKADDSTPAATGTITGKVVDSDGNAVSGAMVIAHEIPANASGDQADNNNGGGGGGGGGGRRGGGGMGMLLGGATPQAGQTTWIAVGITATGDDGTFTLDNAPVGNYQIMVTVPRQREMGRSENPIAVSAGASADAGTITVQGFGGGGGGGGGRNGGGGGGGGGGNGGGNGGGGGNPPPPPQ
ncbi:MAG TPA: hypothetical protein VMG59_04425 [Phycisphaerae bacterium]|nr:hypothetical protein [Phycisphaerae bacterium]